MAAFTIRKAGVDTAILLATGAAHAAADNQAAGTAPRSTPTDEGLGLLEEIVVTAQKRAQSIQDVGIAITAFSQEQLRQFGFQDSFDIARMTPGVHISGNNGGQKTLFTIRGVTHNDFNDQTEAPVAVYVDEGYVAFGQGQTFGMFDLERVEVLKGPQGTLFGRNATGGLVHFVTKKPTRTFDGFSDLTVGSYNHVRFEGALGGPLSSTVSARAAVLYNRFDELIENDYPNRFVTLDGNPLPIGGEDTFNDDTLGLRTHVSPCCTPARLRSTTRRAGRDTRRRASGTPRGCRPDIELAQ